MLFALEEKIKSAIENIINAKNIELIEYKLVSASGGYFLRCIVDYSLGGIVLEDCAQVNKDIVKFLEESNLLGDNFTVEVHSPGLDRKLINYKDFLRVKNKEVLLWLTTPIKIFSKKKGCNQDRDYLEGEILGVNNTNISVKIENDNVCNIDFNIIKFGKEKIKLNM